MVTVRFTIDGEEHETELDGAHPNDVYRKGEDVVDAIEALGYEYIGSPPSIQDLADADRMTRENEILDLGELDAQVQDRSGGGRPNSEDAR